ncbi:MAG: hypothetical protein K2Q18_02410, partial [Bdellovibrionales bacterium]|nr:hypothetical protein [Bdellovibrionales bacterium]
PEDLAVISKVILVAEAFTEHFLECVEKKEKVQMKEILPKLVYEFNSESFSTIARTLVDLPI